MLSRTARRTRRKRPASRSEATKVAVGLQPTDRGPNASRRVATLENPARRITANMVDTCPRRANVAHDRAPEEMARRLDAAWAGGGAMVVLRTGRREDGREVDLPWLHEWTRRHNSRARAGYQ